MQDDKDTKEEKKRSNKQNRALHLWCSLFADTLNEAGLDMKVVLKPEVDIEWNKDTIKKYIWKPILEAITQKCSTAEMSTVDPNKVWEVINRHLGQKFGVEIPKFPNETETKAYYDSLEKKQHG